MFMMRPRRCRRSSRKACVTLNMPLRLTAMISCQSLTTAAGSPVKALRRLIPALLTRAEMRPTLAPTAAATLRQAALSLTSSDKTPRFAAIAFDRRRRLLGGFGVGIERDDRG